MAKSRSKSQEAHYARYKSAKTFETNRKRKLERLIKLQPNNLQLQAALKSIRSPRSTPKVSKWSHTAIADAKMFAAFKKQGPSQPKGTKPLVMHKQPFSFAARAHLPSGNLVWA